jgi:hypothetical protein
MFAFNNAHGKQIIHPLSNVVELCGGDRGSLLSFVKKTLFVRPVLYKQEDRQLFCCTPLPGNETAI